MDRTACTEPVPVQECTFFYLKTWRDYRCSSTQSSLRRWMEVSDRFQAAAVLLVTCPSVGGWSCARGGLDACESIRTNLLRLQRIEMLFLEGPARSVITIMTELLEIHSSARNNEIIIII